MNERMRELELEAIAYADSKVPEDNRYNDIYHSIVRRCMAELIVRECHNYFYDDSVLFNGVDGLLEHFGVEE